MTDSINSGETGSGILSHPHPLRNRHQSRNCNGTKDPETPIVPTPRYSPAPASAATLTKPLGIPSDLSPPYYPPTTCPVNTLTIPEVLIRIGQCIPLWNQFFLELQQFTPQTFICCTSVCRQWHNVLKPLFWYFYDDAHMNKHACLIRVLHHRHIFGGQLFQCRNLIHLSTVPWITGIEDLIRQKPTPETFTWQSTVTTKRSETLRGMLSRRQEEICGS